MAQGENKGGSDNGSSALSKLLSDPEVLRSIAALAGAFGKSTGRENDAAGVQNAPRGGGEDKGFKIPDGLFDDLPEGPQEAEGIDVEHNDPNADDAGSADATRLGADAASVGGDILGSLISSEMLLKLPEVIAAAGPLMQSFGRLREDGAKGGKTFRRGRVPAEKRCALLAAMKPYLSEHRCNTVDMMINLSKFSSIFERK